MSRTTEPNSDEAVLSLSLDGRITDAGDGTRTLLGYRPEELFGRRVEEVIPEPGGLLAGPGKDLGAAADSVSSLFELSCRCADGTVFPAVVTVWRSMEEHGLTITAAIRRLSTEDKLAGAINLVGALVRSSHDAIIAADRDGMITIWNPAAERLYGYSAAEMLGRPRSTIIPPDGQTMEEERFRRTLSGSHVEMFSAVRRRKDGRLITVAATISPIADTQGHIIGVAGFSRDIGETNRAQNMFRGLLNALPIGIIGIGEDGLIRFVNPQIEQLFGYGAEEVLGLPIERLMPRSAAPDLHLEGVRKDGSRFPAEVSLSPIDVGSETLISATVVDTTERIGAEAERVRLQQELTAAQRLESVGQLAGGVAHHFNNLLAIIDSHAGFVAEELNGPITGASVREALTDIAQIRKTVDRASEYARQLLAFGQREVARPVRHDISRTVADVYALLSHSLGDDITLSTNTHKDLPPVVVDPGQLEQTLVNLALNARDAMPHGGKLSITAEPCTKSAPGARPSRHVKIRVTDTGAGMSAEVLERAFEPFFTTKDPVAFAGMGLAVAHGMVTAAGGELSISSDPGRGTTVVIMLPADDVLEPRRDPDETVPGGGAETDGRRTILVVDDEPDLREVVRRMLGKSGYDVITAADGTEAMERVHAHPGRIDLLITDIMMPEMSGTELAEQLREIRDGVPVLFMSGYAAPLLAEKGTLDPGTVLLQKPFRKQELISAVENVLTVLTPS
ncbi:PAS domain S-box-containing protein [Catenuloplanes nepalensis]|uniref:histidine kinase n=1 Tax=Catenuloplanes nepalensis TaxID=587533 RepID=A0ABT9N119_9ACTN|nr:PAS domain S-box protein [Catenuloplanes nepalensis]MDP9797193.1 PAS domain S-box-containing protein [Catenuloplanes nepalensis]